MPASGIAAGITFGKNPVIGPGRLDGHAIAIGLDQEMAHSDGIAHGLLVLKAQMAVGMGLGG